MCYPPYDYHVRNMRYQLLSAEITLTLSVKLSDYNNIYSRHSKAVFPNQVAFLAHSHTAIFEILSRTICKCAFYFD